MSASLIALAVAAITAFSRILLKKGLVDSNPLTGMFVSLVVCAPVLTVLALLVVPLDEYSLVGIAYFAAIGLFAPPVVRYLTYIGVDRLGVSRSAPVRSLTPFFAVLLAIVFLGEPLSLHVVLGTVAIFSGASLLTRKERSERAAPTWKKVDLLFPLAAAVLAGVAANLRRHGLDSPILPNPILAAASTAVAALLVFGVYLQLSGKRRELAFNRSALTFFVLASCCTSVSIVLNLTALKVGNVSAVAPVLASGPLFAIGFSFLLLRKIERVTRTLVAGALLTVTGIELIVFFAPT